MSYVNAADVTSPKDSWKLEGVIYDEEDGSIAVAIGKWMNEGVIALRWNGINEAHKELGNPQSFGKSTWFILPKEFGIAIVKDILVKRALGNECIVEENIEKVVKWLIEVGESIKLY